MAVTSSRSVKAIACKFGRNVGSGREVPVEMPVALSYAGTSHAVMMATPSDLEDFALGFSLSEGIISSLDDVTSIEVVEAGPGIDLQIGLVEERASGFSARRRAMAGPVGCGLCGVELIEEAVQPVEKVKKPSFVLSPREITGATTGMAKGQPLFDKTRAVHAAAFYVPGRGVVAVREDVGRHNALDKLRGTLARTGEAPTAGVVLMTSRVSVELIQKTARAGAAFLVAVSAPTTLAIEMADAAGICLIGVARGNDFEIFTHADYVDMADSEGVTIHVA